VRVLVTRLRYLGDIIISTPVISALRKCFPDAEIYYLAEAPYVSLLRDHPDLDGIIVAEKGLAGTIRTIIRLRRMSFSAAVDLFYNPRSANILYLSGIPVRIGGSRRWRARLYTRNFEVPSGTRSAVMHHLSAIEPLGCRVEEALPAVHIGRDAGEYGAGIIDELKGEETDTRVIAVHPGGTWPSKRWPPSSYIELTRRLRAELGCVVALVTGPGEEDTTSAISSAAGNGVHALPVRDIVPLAGIISACDAVIANDGGIMHLAVALGRPTVGIFGPTEPEIWFPYEGKGPFGLVTHRVDCSPCHLHHCDDMRCLYNIPTDEVISKLLEVTGW
jgi:ADP-heptose:LPS heptosyltransferase